MKNRFLLLAIMVLGVGGRVAAQHEGHHGAGHKYAAGAKLSTANDTAAQMLTVRVGPLRLPAHTDHMAATQARDQVLAIPFDGWITAYHPRLTDGKGNTLPGRMLHHVAFWNSGRPDFLCPNKEEHIFGAGGEMNDWPALAGFGYRVRRGERIRVNTMFHNPTDTSYPEVFIEVKMEYQRAGKGAELKSVYPVWFDVQQCGDSGYDLKPGKNVTTGKFGMGYNGVLLGVGGHMHDFGRRLVLARAGQKGTIATLEPKTDPGGRLISMPIVTFADRGGLALARGEVLEVTAAYDNRSGEHLRQGAMGIVVGYFVPAEDRQLAGLRRGKKAGG